MADWLVTLVVALIASVPGVVSLVVQARKSKAEAGKAEADAVESMSQAALVLLSPLKTRVRELEASDAEKAARLDMLTSYVEYLENGIQALVGQLTMNGHRANWQMMPLSEFRVRRVMAAEGDGCE